MSRERSVSSLTAANNIYSSPSWNNSAMCDLLQHFLILSFPAKGKRQPAKNFCQVISGHPSRWLWGVLKASSAYTDNDSLPRCSFLAQWWHRTCLCAFSISAVGYFHCFFLDHSAVSKTKDSVARLDQNCHCRDDCSDNDYNKGQFHFHVTFVSLLPATIIISLAD